MNIYKVTYVVTQVVDNDYQDVHGFIPITCTTAKVAVKACKAMLPNAKRVKAHLIEVNV